MTTTATPAPTGRISLTAKSSKVLKPPYPSDWAFSSIDDPEMQCHITGYAIPLTPPKVNAFLWRELNVDRLNVFHRHLWACGRRGNIHPLHWQKMVSRDIFITEDANLHLLWFKNCIYVKALPECLLHYSFFDTWICGDEEVYGNACGLLLSYVRLVVHRSDFEIAKALGCLPPTLTWLQWSEFSEHLNAVENRIPVNKRYLYGELRLSRLNLLAVLLLRTMAYHAVDRSYTSFAQNFAWLLVAFAYQSIIVSCFQLLTVVDTKPCVFSAARWVSGILLSVIGIIISLQVGTFIIVFLWNWSRAAKPIYNGTEYPARSSSAKVS